VHPGRLPAADTAFDVYGNGSLKFAGQSEKQLGELALLTNEFLQFDPAQSPRQATTLGLASVIPSGRGRLQSPRSGVRAQPDVYNPD
jgi:hypothetical protein